MTYEQFLRSALDANKRIKSPRLQRVLAMAPGRRRDRILDRMEAHTRADLAHRGIKVGRDWKSAGTGLSAVDWQNILTTILKILEAVIPIILKFIVVL